MVPGVNAAVPGVTATGQSTPATVGQSTATTEAQSTTATVSQSSSPTVAQTTTTTGVTTQSSTTSVTGLSNNPLCKCFTKKTDCKRTDFAQLCGSGIRKVTVLCLSSCSADKKGLKVFEESCTLAVSLLVI